jgi:hypothetical protein
MPRPRKLRADKASTNISTNIKNQKSIKSNQKQEANTLKAYPEAILT